MVCPRYIKVVTEDLKHLGFKIRSGKLSANKLKMSTLLEQHFSLMQKWKFQCAWMAAVFNLPMSTITLIEDLLMVLMSGE